LLLPELGKDRMQLFQDYPLYV